MRFRILALVLTFGVQPGFASETYKNKCALCHDSGATLAPRAGEPKAGFPELSLDTVLGVAGVRDIENRLVSADIFEHD